VHATTEYATKVVSGETQACACEVQACERHIRDLARVGVDKGFDYVFDAEKADRIIKWFSICRHVRGAFAGQPIVLEDWQVFDLGSIFGWVHVATGRRRFKTAYIRIARGNAKSTTMSGLACYGMCGDAFWPPGHPESTVFESSPEVVCVAVDREQANIVWGDAREMALASPDIEKRLDIKKGSISHLTRGGSLKKLSKDTKNKDGGAPCLIIIDELQAHPDAKVKNIVGSGKGKRAQCLEMIITTAGDDAENKPCKKEDDYSRKILAGEIVSDRYFCMIRELDDDDDPHDDTKWSKSSPILRSENEYANTLLEEIRDEHDNAYNSGDNSKIREWLIKRANRFQTDIEHKYFTGCMKKYKENAVSVEDFLKKINKKICWCGLDLSKTTDLTAVGWAVPLPDGYYAVDAHGFMPQERAIEHEHSDRVPYRDWAAQGWCTLTPGSVTDYDFVENYIHDCEKSNEIKVQEFCFDPYNASHFVQTLEKNGGYRHEQMCEVRQGSKTLSVPTKKFRELVLQKKIIHNGNPLLIWCLSNAIEIIDGGENIRLSKKYKSDTQRIDLISAIINALTHALVSKPEFIYQKRGMRSL
jgi:phage terminase large subunit-like protein